jgi:hypothetical protein
VFLKINFHLIKPVLILMDYSPRRLAAEYLERRTLLSSMRIAALLVSCAPMLGEFSVSDEPQWVFSSEKRMVSTRTENIRRRKKRKEFLRRNWTECTETEPQSTTQFRLNIHLKFGSVQLHAWFGSISPERCTLDDVGWQNISNIKLVIYLLRLISH